MSVLMRAGVMGWPVEQSLSPKLHGMWLRSLGLQGEYTALPVRPEDLQDAFLTFPKQGYRGWNITVPHKEQALRLVDEVDATALAIGAVNTVVVNNNGELNAFNTDVYGFIHNLRSTLGDLNHYKECALVLGAGGAARAVVHGLKEEGWKRILITNRTAGRAQFFSGNAEEIAWDQKSKDLDQVSLLVNTTTLGMIGQPPLEMPLDALAPQAAVCDIVYKPLITPLLAAAQARGNPIVTGIGMLIHQAVPGFRAWFGQDPPMIADIERVLLA